MSLQVGVLPDSRDRNVIVDEGWIRRLHSSVDEFTNPTALTAQELVRQRFESESEERARLLGVGYRGGRQPRRSSDHNQNRRGLSSVFTQWNWDFHDDLSLRGISEEQVRSHNVPPVVTREPSVESLTRFFYGELI